MKHRNEEKAPSCEKIEELLMRRTCDRLTVEEERLLGKHLAACTRCREYHQALEKVVEAVKPQENRGLVPNPAIRENILKRMRMLKPQKIGLLERAWKSTRSAFAHPIPVYQAVLGAALIFLLSVGLKHLPSSTVREVSQPRPLVRMEAALPSQLGVIDNLDIVKQQKIGQSVTEDTTLTRFIVSSM
jgi:predicted anti-sigma-YlaC factor YlaD